MGEIRFCLTDSLEKVFPDRAPRPLENFRLTAWPGEVVSFQLAGCGGTAPGCPFYLLPVHFSGSASPLLRVRRVELEPAILPAYADADDNYLLRTPGMIPDILTPFADDEPLQLRCLCGQWSSLWCDLRVPDDAAAGERELCIAAEDGSGQEIFRSTLTLCIQADALPPQKLLHTEWFHTDCLADYYGVPVWSEEHWRIIGNFMAGAAAVGINMLLAPLFTPALDTAVGHERTTTQLVEVWAEDGGYRFGFDRLDRWIDLCREHGIREFEMCHLFTQWGAAAAPKVIAWVDGREKRIFGWDTPAVGGAYTPFLRQFLPALKAHLQQLQVLDHCWFHISDEPNEACLDNWKAARATVVDLLEGCHMMDALSSLSFYEQGLIQTPVVNENRLDIFAEKEIPGLWTYYCCGQYKEVPNRFLAMPSARSRILGTLLYRYGLTGFLQWGFNFYNGLLSLSKVDPWRNADGMGTWPAGDPFLVYPGADGQPVESLRAAVVREAMQDHRLLLLAEQKLGRPAVLQLLRESWDGGDMTMVHYPTDPAWFVHLRRTLQQHLA